MKTLITLALSLFCLNSQATILTVEMNSQVVPPDMQFTVRVSPDKYAINSTEIGTFPAYDVVPMGNVTMFKLNLPTGQIMGYESVYLSSSSNSCIWGAIPVAAGGGDFYGTILNTCRGIDSWYTSVFPGPGPAPGSKNCGVSNRDKAICVAAVLQKFDPNATIGICHGDCSMFTTKKCLPQDLIPLPGSEYDVNYTDSNGNGIPDTYNWAPKPGVQNPKTLHVKVVCECVNPDANNP